MGQINGRISPVKEIHPFLNLSQTNIQLLWSYFNDYADGFGLISAEFDEICNHLHEDLGCSPVVMKQYSNVLFKCIDTDKNNLIDALEVLSLLAALSGMNLHDILLFILSTYDFNGGGQLNIDEVTLALKSLTIGLCKISHTTLPKEQLLEALVSDLFEKHVSNNDPSSSHSESLPIKLLVLNLTTHPVILSWFHAYGSPTSQYTTTSSTATSTTTSTTSVNIVTDSSNNSNQALWTILNSTSQPSTNNNWKTITSDLKPAAYSNTVLGDLPPQSSLDLVWLYGYEAERCNNNNIYYNINGDILYPVSKYIIQLDINNNKQKIFHGHTDIITCFICHPNKILFASGQEKIGSVLFIWDSITFNIKFSSKYHNQGILQTCFSKDGSYLASIGNTSIKTLAVHHWSSNTLIYTSLINKDNTYGILFLKNESVIVIGTNYLYLWSNITTTTTSTTTSTSMNNSSKIVLKRRGNFTKACPMTTLTCITLLLQDFTFVTGTNDGHLYLWHDRNTIRSIKAHHGQVTTLFSNDICVLSGGIDHRIRCWTHKLEPGIVLDIFACGLNSSIKSLTLSTDSSRVLVGTIGCNIHELSMIDGSDIRGSSLTNAHYIGKINYIVANPTKASICSVGDDGTIRIWDLNTHTLIKVAKFDSQINCVSYSPSGDLIAIGFGDKVGSTTANASQVVDTTEASEGSSEVYTKCGAYTILNETDLSVLHEAKDTKFPLTCILISNDNETLAVGSSEGIIYLYALLDEYEFIGKCTRHTSSIIAMDFSVSGEIIRSNSKNGEVYFFNTDDAAMITASASLRDIEWFSHNCIYTWSSTSAHNTDLMNEEINCSLYSIKDNILIYGTNYGYIKIYIYPVVNEVAKCIRVNGHVNNINKIVSTYESNYIVSIGEYDRCIAVWKVNSSCINNNITSSSINSNISSELSVDHYGLLAYTKHELENYLLTLNTINTISLHTGDKYIDESNSSIKDLIIPSIRNDNWLNTIISPSIEPIAKKEIPKVSLILDYIYGYSCIDMKNNIMFTNKTDEIIYIASSISIVYNLTTKLQRYNRIHNNTISAMTVSNDGSLIATASIGKECRVVIWEVDDLKIITQINDTFMNSILTLAFNNMNNHIVIISFDTNYTLSLYDWKYNILLSRCYGMHSKYTSLVFKNQSNCFVATTLDSILFYDTESNFIRQIHSSTSSTTNTSTTSTTSSSMKGPYLCCVNFSDHSVIGSLDGHLHLFNDSNMLIRSIQAHMSSVDCLTIHPTNTTTNTTSTSKTVSILLSSGKDNKIIIWNSTFIMIKEIQVDNIIKTIITGVTSLTINKDGKKLVIGLCSGQIIQVNLENILQEETSTSIINYDLNVLSQGHCNKKILGLSSHPTKNIFATSSDDRQLNIYDSNSYNIIKSIKLDCPSRCIDFSKDNKYLAIGYGNNSINKIIDLKDGSFVVYNMVDFKKVHEGKDTNESITIIKFSNNNKYLAVGSIDSKIYIYNVDDLFSLRIIITHHKAPIQTIDFNTDSTFIMSSDITLKINYSDITSGVLIPSYTALRDEKWATWSNLVGWPVVGLWLNRLGEVDICTVNKSNSGSLVASGNNRGLITIANYPCFTRSGFVHEIAHTGPVGSIVWLAGDTHIITTGSTDGIVIQWKCIYEESKEIGNEILSNNNNNNKSNFKMNDIIKEYDIYGGHEYSINNIIRQINTEGKIQLWRNFLCPPTGSISSPIKENRSKPNVTIELEYIHGNRLQDTQFAMCYNNNNNPVYFNSKYGLINLQNEYKQNIYNGHTNGITCIDITRCGLITATGDCGINPEIHIWDANTGIGIKIFNNIHRCGITCLSFNSVGHSLICLGQDIQHSIVILHTTTGQWNDSFVLTSIATTSTLMLWTLYLNTTSYPIVVGGIDGLLFIQFNNYGVRKVKGVYGKDRIIQPLVCGITACTNTTKTSLATSHTTTATNTTTNISNHTNDESCVITGTISGHIYIWENQEIIAVISAHDQTITGLNKINNIQYASSSIDGIIKIWTSEFILLHTINSVTFNPLPIDLNFSFLTSNEEGSKLGVGMKSGEIYEVCLHTKTNLLINQSHYKLHLIALSCHPINSDLFITAGEDGLIIVWSISSKNYICKTEIDSSISVVTWSPDGSKIIIGIGSNTTSSGTSTGSSGSSMNCTKDGAFMILESTTLNVLFEDRKSKCSVTDICWNRDKSSNPNAAHDNNSSTAVAMKSTSNNNNNSSTKNDGLIVIGCLDTKIYIHSATSYEILHVIELPNLKAFTWRLELSSNMNYCRVATTVDTFYDIDILNNAIVSLPTVTQDVSWGKYTTPYHWLTQGVWRPMPQGVMVLAIAVNVMKSIVAVSYQDGSIRLYRFPCTQHGNGYLEVNGVLSLAPRLEFTNDGEYLIVIDAYTRSVLQYKMEYQELSIEVL